MHFKNSLVMIWNENFKEKKKLRLNLDVNEEKWGAGNATHVCECFEGKILYLCLWKFYQKKNLACWIFLLNSSHLRDSHGKFNFTVEQFSVNTRYWASHFLKFLLKWAQTTHFAYHLAKSKHFPRTFFSLSIAVFLYLLFSSSCFFRRLLFFFCVLAHSLKSNKKWK